jgi:hypothetical protein
LSVVNSELSASNRLESSHTKPATGESLQAASESGSKTKQETAKVPEVFLSNGKFNAEATHWLPSHIVDQLYMQMCESKEIPIEKQLLTDEIYCEKQNKYYAEAATYAVRISVGDFSGVNAKHRPVFQIDLADFSPRLKVELAQSPKETVHRIVTEAIAQNIQG